MSDELADRTQRSWGGPYAVRLYRSGTEALALAMLDSKLRLAHEAPEIIIPAYGCPDLIAACLFAGVRPVLVDTANGAWGYDLGELRAACTPNTVAIVAMNLLGVGDQGAMLQSLAKDAGCLLIQDCAQYLPQAHISPWRGDYVVFSFGRGKPLNLLRGGALLLPPERSGAVHFKQAPTLGVRLRDSLLGSRAAGIAFNLATHPVGFRFASMLPGLELGTTSYRVLSSVSELPGSVWQQLAAALIGYGRTAEYSTALYKPFLSGWEKCGIQALTCAESVAEVDGQRLRLPLLAANSIQRDTIVSELNREGLGSSRMYGAAMNAIGRMPQKIARQGPFHNATSLALRLFTLPTHSFVSEEAASRSDCIVRRAART